MSFTILNAVSAPPVKGILFDMDGVILDTEKLYARFWAEACAFYGYSMNYEQALGMRSLNSEAGQTYLSSLYGPGIRIDTVKAKRIELMDRYVAEHGVEAKPAVYGLLDYLNANHIPCAVTSSSPRERIEHYLGQVGLLNRFDRICTAKEVAHGKPEPDIYLHGAECIGIPPEACMALEDSYTGIVSAVKAGCRAVIVPDLDQPGENITSAAWAKADSLTDVIDLIKTYSQL